MKMRNLARTTILAAAFALAGCDLFEDMAIDSLVERLNAEAAVQNAKIKIAFDPARETIITDSAPFLVRDYALDYAHRQDENVDGSRGAFASYRMVRYPGCKKVRPAGDFSFILGQSRKPGLCELHIFAERPSSTALTTELTRRLVDVEGYKVSQISLTINRPDGRKATLVFYPGRSDLAYEAAPKIASALGLRPRGTDVSGVPGPDEVDRLIEAAMVESGGIKYAWLDELAQRDPVDDQGLSPSRFAPAEIAKRAEALTRRFEQKAPQASTARYWKFIGDVLVQLPQDGWLRYRDRIAAALLRAPREAVMEQKKLILRIADMAAAAGPVLAHATGDGFVHSEIAISTCRAGAPVAPYMAKRLMAAWKASNSPQLVSFESRRRWRRVHGWRGGLRGELRRKEWERCTEHGKKYGPPANIAFSVCWAIPDSRSEASPTYLALRRMGLGAEADGIMRHEYSRHWKKTYASIGPASPAEVCGESGEI
jgi:hypothetical protein